jgi:sugar (glycoside-pentoside-hexuronide) transporter
MEQKNELKFSEKLIWALGQSTGRQFITALVSTYILVFLTDVFGIAAGAAGVIMTIATVWDAINDPMLGSIADKTKSRWGKYRPYLLFVPLPLSIVAVLLFAAPELSATGKIVYAAVLYICYGMLVTCIEIPYTALLPTMTRNEMERNDAISLSTFIASLVILVVTSFTPDLVKVIGGDRPNVGYMAVVAVGAVCMCVTSWLAFTRCKERYLVEKKEESAIRSFGKLMKIGRMYPMMAFWCVGCILFNLIMASSVYYVMYYLANPALIASYMLCLNISGMIGVMVFMPIILRKTRGSMKKTVLFTQSVSAVCFLVCFLIAGRSVAGIYIFSFIGCLFATMTNAFRPMTVVGMTDYVLDRTGEQLNGTITAIGGFAYKCGTAVSNAIIAGMLAATGYIANAIGQEPEAFMSGINAVRFLVPFIATIIYMILIQFYPEGKTETAEKAEKTK